MKRLLILALIGPAVSMISCNNEPKQAAESTTTPAADTAPTMHAMIPNTTCYLAVVNKDSFKLKLEKFPNVATGSLSYHFFEKDSNHGTIDGTISGDTLLADYTFMSEGKQSVRQVAFLIKDSTAREGYGPMEEKDGKMIFKSRDKIEFVTGAKMLQVNCPVE